MEKKWENYQPSFICRACGVKLTSENWYPSSRERRFYICIPCLNERHNKYRKENKEFLYAKERERLRKHPEARRKYVKRYIRELRDEAFKQYGGAKCACCSVAEDVFLTLDHIKGDGAEERRNLGINGGWSFYKWLKDHGFPPGYRVLCRNCNWAIYQLGYCPHQRRGQG